MTSHEFRSLIGKIIVYKNPQGRLNTIEVQKNNIENLLDLQKHGWKFIKPMESTGNQCISCEG